MAVAKECDLCGGLYKPYNTADSSKKPNGIRLVTISDDRRYYNNLDLYDCCPKCMSAINKILKDLGDKKNGKKNND